MENSLSIMRPNLVEEWSDKNLPITPNDISYGSNKKVWWIGKCGHEWQTSVKARSHGENCPICSGARIIEGVNDLATTHPNIAKEWSEKNLPMKPSMISSGSHKKFIWKDALGHEWRASVKSRVQGSGCPYCSHNAVLPGFNDLENKFPNIAAEWSERNFPVLPNQVTAFKNQKAWWKCKTCGHEWETLISTRSGGSKCPYCSGLKLLKGFNDFKTTHPSIAEEWSEKNYPLKPDMINEKSTKNVWWKCKTCGYEYKAVIKSRVRGLICPVCADRVVCIGVNDLKTTDPHLLEEWDYEKNIEVSPTEITRNSMRFVWWKCETGHSWRARIFERTINNERCRCCEQEFQNIFYQLVVMLYANRKGLKVVVDSDETIGVNLSTFVPEIRLVVELIETSEKKKRQQAVKEHICNCNNIKYVGIRSTRDMYKTISSVKEAFRKCHIYISSDDESDIQFLREWFFANRKSLKGLEL